VRNPLSAAISANSFVSIAVNESVPLSNEEARRSTREDVAVIGNSLQYINDLLRSMLDFHCALSKQITIAKKHVGIRHDIFDPVASMLYNRGVVFDILIDCPEDLVVLADPLRLKQVILNLALNATKFVTKGFVRLVAEADADTVTLSVEDSGPGIPTNKRIHIFSKFQASLDASSQGTGIGLSLCKSLVELMDGRIHLDESYNSGISDCPGTRFVVSLDGPPTEWSYRDIPESSRLEWERPKIHADTETIDNSGSLSAAELESATKIAASPAPSECVLPESSSVLFVDDDFILRKLFVRSVKRCRPNWVVSEAASGEAAVQLIEDGDETNSYDVVFMDQYMASTQKQLLGTETVRLLRSKGFDGIICGLSANDIGPQFIEAGADSFIMKPLPCESSELAFELCRVLASRENYLADASNQV
jgi:CheY-like chemotaxis protein